MSAPPLRAGALRKDFGGHRVLHDVSPDVAEGETVAVIGPSGSGKTTMLRCLNHLERPDGGSVALGGVDLARLRGGAEVARGRRAFGFVFQRFNLFPHLSALDNVAAGPRLALGEPRARAREAAMARLEQVAMAAHAHERPWRLSGGQQQRVAIARALAMRPRVMLYDEPTSALDPEPVAEVLAVMARLAREGMTAAVVTHEIRFARQVADRVAVMADGRIVEEGPAAQVIDAPASAATRRFLRHLHGK